MSTTNDCLSGSRAAASAAPQRIGRGFQCLGLKTYGIESSKQNNCLGMSWVYGYHVNMPEDAYGSKNSFLEHLLQ